MKCFNGLLSCCLVVLAVMCGCGKSENEDVTAPASAPAKSKQFVFTVGFDADFPPYGFFKDGQYQGFDLDLAREVCKRRGWKFVAKPINWDAKDMELNSGGISCIWNGFTINGRENDYEWSSPYVDNSQVVLVLDKSDIKDLSGLKGKTVAVQTDTPVQKALTAGGDCEELGKSFKRIVVTPNYNNAVMELESGAVQAVAMDIGVANLKVAENNKFRILPESVISEKYGIGFRKGNTDLRDKVQETLCEMARDGSAAEISARYFDGNNVLILQ